MGSPLITLNSRRPIPALGFGTYRIAPKDAGRSLSTALATGYRHIDTAQMYGNEAAIGDYLIESGVPRESLFITSKLNNPNHEPDRVAATFEQTLADLKTDYVDLFLIHWPLPTRYNGDFVTTWRAMEALAESGRARSIGVSNFQIPHLERLLAETHTAPAVNQIELHPHFTNSDVAQFCAEHDIAVESWSPIGRASYADDPILTEIADGHGATVSQVILAWHRQKGYIAIPKARGHEHQAENFASLEVTLTADDIAAVDSLDRGEEGRIGPHPDTFDMI